MTLPIAVVTGASRGIGHAIALALVEKGHEVWALARNLDALKALEKQAPAGRIHALAMNAENADDVTNAAAQILKNGIPSVLVNNAGVALSKSLKDTDDKSWQRLFAVNVTAPFLLCREFMPAMASTGFGRVINIASTAGVKGFKYTSGYCASKHALLGLTKSLALEYADKGVTVNAVCPGWTDTDIVSQAAGNIARTTGRTEEEARHRISQFNPMKRLVTPQEVAALVTFLASQDTGSINGASYLIDGGETA